jgi:hypothetical protein
MKVLRGVFGKCKKVGNAEKMYNENLKKLYFSLSSLLVGRLSSDRL